MSNIIFSNTNIGPVLPSMFIGCPANIANATPVVAAANMHSMTPCVNNTTRVSELNRTLFTLVNQRNIDNKEQSVKMTSEAYIPWYQKTDEQLNIKNKILKYK